VICVWCNGECDDADLAPLLDRHLMWLWEQLARTADRRGDTQLTSGSVDIVAPDAAEQRLAAIGLLNGVGLRPGQRRRIDLLSLTAHLRNRGARLTPGAVAAHATQRRLAVQVNARLLRATNRQQLRERLETLTDALPEEVRARVSPDLWERLQRTTWIARILDHPNPAGYVDGAFAVLARLPVGDTRVDRRTLVPGDPHALDENQPLAGLVLALTNTNVGRSRAGWNSLGVDRDDLVGGLIIVGLRPEGWNLPSKAVFTVPPRELINITWQAPPAVGMWAFVTENPSVLAAAAEIAARHEGPGRNGTVHLLCTVGTPSETETRAVGALAKAGWRVAVRADFDREGLSHVRALMAGAPTAIPWRMGRADYAASPPGTPAGLIVATEEAPWEPSLAVEMTISAAPAYEEDLLPSLMADLRQGTPGRLA
jgi:uncharacterized protein (TIGR02679 family)